MRVDGIRILLSLQPNVQHGVMETTHLQKRQHSINARRSSKLAGQITGRQTTNSEGYYQLLSNYLLAPPSRIFNSGVTSQLSVSFPLYNVSPRRGYFKRWSAICPVNIIKERLLCLLASRFSFRFHYNTMHGVHCSSSSSRWCLINHRKKRVRGVTIVEDWMSVARMLLRSLKFFVAKKKKKNRIIIKTPFHIRNFEANLKLQFKIKQDKSFSNEFSLNI